jgi:hypothetical protein
MPPEQPQIALPTALRLDALSIETLVECFPPDLRSDIRWLATYLRDGCHSNLDTLVERGAPLGLETDKTTWSRVLRGRWNLDGEGKPLDSPVVSPRKLARAIDTLRLDASRRDLYGQVPFIETTVWDQIRSYIDIKRLPERANRFGLIIGHTGSQKTACYKEYRRRSDAAPDQAGCCIRIEAPVRTGHMAEFMRSLARAFGFDVSLSSARLRAKVSDAITYKHCLIIDNAQELYIAADGDEQSVFSWLKRIQDERNCAVILSITPTFEVSLTSGYQKDYFEQFVGRAGGRRNFLRLPQWPPEEDVLKISKAFGLREPDNHLDYLVKISREPGRIRILFEDLQSAKQLANGKPLTISHVKNARDEE